MNCAIRWIKSKRMLSLAILLISIVLIGCNQSENKKETNVNKTAKQILGNPKYQAISYGGYRMTSRNIQPSVALLKEDLLIMHAMGIRVLRTYNVHLAHASNVLKAISELGAQDSSFEMYVMLGAWIDCKNAWTDIPPIHNEESDRNAKEIDKAVKLANQYPDIVKVIAVGNEAMVKWATTYYVEPWIILKWVKHLQAIKSEGGLPSDLWITSSDNFASWGGGEDVYKVNELNELIKSVDFISMHTYPMHDTHYNPDFWHELESEQNYTDSVKIERAMERSLAYAKNQYDSVVAYMKSKGIDKPVYIGETGWASSSDGHYGEDGSGACDEYKQKLYHDKMRAWTNENNISCFFFEAFDEQWKDAGNSRGSENHFGLFDIDGKAKYALWDEVNKGTFKGLGRNGTAVEKTFNGDYDKLKQSILVSSPALVD